MIDRNLILALVSSYPFTPKEYLIQTLRYRRNEERPLIVITPDVANSVALPMGEPVHEGA